MKKIFTASLVAMMAVTAANADIASTGYVDQRTGDTSKLETTATELTGAVNELKTQLGTVSGTAGNAATKSELTAAQEALEDAIETEKGRIDALDSTYATDEALTDGLALKEDIANKVTSFDDGSASDVKYPSTSAVKQYVSTSTSAIQTDMESVKTALAGKQATISDLETIRSGATAGAVAEENAKRYADDIVGELADGAVASNTDAISAISNAETGILAQAKADAELKDAALTEAYEAADSSLKAELQGIIDEVATNAGTNLTDALKDYSTTTQMNTAISSANETQTQAIRTAYQAADTALDTKLSKAITDGDDATLDSAKNYADQKDAAAKTAADAAYAAKSYEAIVDADKAFREAITAGDNTVTGDGADGTYALTATVSGGVVSGYKWELIGR